MRARLTAIVKSVGSTISPLQGITAALITLGTGAARGSYITGTAASRSMPAGCRGGGQSSRQASW